MSQTMMRQIQERPRTRQHGQAITEAVLIMFVLLAVSGLVGKYFKEKNIMASLVQGPWNHINSMIQFGVWTADPQTAASQHPNIKRRHATSDPSDSGAQR